MTYTLKQSLLPRDAVAGAGTNGNRIPFRSDALSMLVRTWLRFCQILRSQFRLLSGLPLPVLVSLSAATATADGSALGNVALNGGANSSPHQRCEQFFTRRLNTPAHVLPANTGPQSVSDAHCLRHPWVRELDLWRSQGMPVETAMLWRITTPDSDTHPILTGELADLARMRAAYSLALAGHLPDAKTLWRELSMRRPEWAEPWFNLGLVWWVTGDTHRADIHFEKARQLCAAQGCRIQADDLQRFSTRKHEAP